jgi:hypothetical protein
MWPAPLNTEPHPFGSGGIDQCSSFPSFFPRFEQRSPSYIAGDRTDPDRFAAPGALFFLHVDADCAQCRRDPA